MPVNQFKASFVSIFVRNVFLKLFVFLIKLNYTQTPYPTKRQSKYRTDFVYCIRLNKFALMTTYGLGHSEIVFFRAIVTVIRVHFGLVIDES